MTIQEKAAQIFPVIFLSPRPTDIMEKNLSDH